MANNGGRRDIKSLTKTNKLSAAKRFLVIDQDIGSQYDYDDEEPIVVRHRPIRSSSPRLASHGRVRPDRPLYVPSRHGVRKETVFKIIVRDAIKNSDREVHPVLMQLLESVDNFYPIAPAVVGENIEFFVYKRDTAEALKSMSRRITDRDSGKLLISHNKEIAPWESLRPVVKQSIEQVVWSRYNQASNSLDLSDFASEKRLTSLNNPSTIALFNNAVMLHVVEVISQHFPSIKGLSLKGNRLRSLDYVSTLVFVAPKVTELDLSSNALSRIELLKPIQSWLIEKLHLENNELCNKFQDGSEYSRGVHECFPRVNYLDGTSIVAANPFYQNDGGSESTPSISNLPQYKRSEFPDEAVSSLMAKFLEEYITLYDGADSESKRKLLINAYDDSATFTFSIHFLPDTHKIPKGDEEAYHHYIKNSHNIIQEQKWHTYREKIIYKGAMDIAVALSKLPATQHVKESLIVDYNLVTAGFISFTLQGIVRDGEDAFSTSPNCKFFVRNFLVAVKGDGSVAILSDILALTPISNTRLERFNLLRKRAEAAEDAITNQMNGAGQSSSSAGFEASAAPPPTPQPVLGYDINDPAVRAEMIKQFSEQSGMKPEWSEKCLIDSSWNFDTASRVFNELRSSNSIPSQAFK